MGIGRTGGHAAAWRSLDESSLQQEGLIGLFNRVGFLSDHLRQCGEANGSAIESLAQDFQD